VGREGGDGDGCFSARRKKRREEGSIPRCWTANWAETLPYRWTRISGGGRGARSSGSTVAASMRQEEKKKKELFTLPECLPGGCPLSFRFQEEEKSSGFTLKGGKKMKTILLSEEIVRRRLPSRGGGGGREREAYSLHLLEKRRVCRRLITTKKGRSLPLYRERKGRPSAMWLSGGIFILTGQGGRERKSREGGRETIDIKTSEARHRRGVPPCGAVEGGVSPIQLGGERESLMVVKFRAGEFI